MNQSPIKPILVGIGPFAMNTHLKHLRELETPPALVVEVESRRQETRAILNAFGFAATELLLVEDRRKSARELPEPLAGNLSRWLDRSGTSHAIVSCEPRGRLAYLRYFLARGMRTFCDKPLSAVEGSSVDESAAWRLYEDYLSLAEAYPAARGAGARVFLNVQRRFLPSFRFIRDLIQKTASDYAVPLTDIEISACDGTWNMPEEYLTNENHAYRYGFGKLMFSGFHYVDLLALVLQSLPPREEEPFDGVRIAAHATRPADLAFAMGRGTYARCFPDSDAGPGLDRLRAADPRRFGEVDVQALLQFRKEGRVITTSSLKLLSTGYSRRAWLPLPVDTYRKNGRVRHETLSVQIGPLMNIRLQEFQINKETSSPVKISIFRNSALLGGRDYEELTLDGRDSHGSRLREDTRRTILRRFLRDEPLESELPGFRLSLYLTAALSAALARDDGILRSEWGAYRMPPLHC